MALPRWLRRRLLRWLVFVVAGAIVGEVYTDVVLMPNMAEHIRLPPWVVTAKAETVAAHDNKPGN